jgi:hypothetical protein
MKHCCPLLFGYPQVYWAFEYEELVNVKLPYGTSYNVHTFVEPDQELTFDNTRWLKPKPVHHQKVCSESEDDAVNEK